jgi:hypothetical protein
MSCSDIGGEMNDEIKALARELESDLLTLYGSPVLTGESLQKALGFKSLDALRQSISRGTIPVKVFSIKNRRGKYALIKDIAYYLASQARSN